MTMTHLFVLLATIAQTPGSAATCGKSSPATVSRGWSRPGISLRAASDASVRLYSRRIVTRVRLSRGGREGQSGTQRAPRTL